MSEMITVRVDHAEWEPGRIRGFRFFWAFWVGGFNSDRHCQPCFQGKRVADFCTPTAQSGRTYSMKKPDSCQYLYICGVGQGPKHLLGEKNFHLALEFAEESALTRQTYNGYLLTVNNVRELTIPPLPPGWQGLDLETTRCKNFQFAVAYFGYSTPQRVGAEHPAR